jgi:hypothetical protein
MPTVHLFNYPDTAAEPVDFTKFIKKSGNSDDAPSVEQIKKLNDLRKRMVSLLLSQPNTKPILDVSVLLFKIIFYILRLSKNIFRN